MHAMYSFLMELPIKLCDKDLKAEATAQFELDYVPLCDENNWYQESALITKSGRVIQLCGKGDYRGRDSWYGAIKKVKPEKRWDWAWKFALDCLATDLQLFDVPSKGILPDPKGARKKIAKMSFDEVLKAIQEWIPRVLSSAYATIQVGRNDKKDIDLRLADWRRQKRASTFAILNDCSKPPFASPRSPYEYRAYTLCDSEKGNAVMLVDIHT